MLKVFRSSQLTSFCYPSGNFKEIICTNLLCLLMLLNMYFFTFKVRYASRYACSTVTETYFWRCQTLRLDLNYFRKKFHHVWQGAKYASGLNIRSSPIFFQPSFFTSKDLMKEDPDYFFFCSTDRYQSNDTCCHNNKTVKTGVCSIYPSFISLFC